MGLFLSFSEEFWRVLLELSPYLLLGLLFAGLLNAFVSRQFVAKHLNGNRIWSSVKAALLGVPLPLCSCGVIPSGIAFKKQGASNGATVSFLVSTPQTGIDSIMVTYSMLNLPWAVFRPLIAFVSGIVAGSITPTDKSEKANAKVEWINHEQDTKDSLWQRIFVYAFVNFLQDISRPLFIGILIAAGISAFVPQSWFELYLNSPLINMLVILVVSVPLYVCATGSVPIAASLLLKGLSPGAALVFLMAGPATNAATISVLFNTLGKKVTAVYVASIVGFSLFFGVLMDYVLPAKWFVLSSSELMHHHRFLPDWLSVSAAVLLLILLGYVESKKLLKKKVIVTDMEKVYKIDGMTCNHCKANVDKTLKNLDGVECCEVDLDRGTAKIKGDVSDEKIEEAIQAIGYNFKGRFK